MINTFKDILLETFALMIIGISLALFAFALVFAAILPIFLIEVNGISLDSLFSISMFCLFYIFWIALGTTIAIRILGAFPDERN